MNAIASLITFIASRFTVWIGGIFAAKFAAVASLIAVYTSIFVVAYVGLDALVAGISMAVHEDLSRAMSWWVPDNTLPCMTAGFGAWVIRATMDYHSGIVRLWASAL